MPFEPLLAGDRPLSFAIGLLVGGLALFVAGRYLTGEGDYGNALLTALVGTLAWAVLASVPLLGTALALVAWVAVIRWRYPGGWVRAATIGAAAWAVAVVGIAALSLVGIGGVEALSVPGT